MAQQPRPQVDGTIGFDLKGLDNRPQPTFGLHRAQLGIDKEIRELLIAIRLRLDAIESKLDYLITKHK